LRRPILKNYLTLMVSSLGVWLAMFANRAIIVRLAGAEALGLYQMVFPAYRLIATIVTIGLPTVLTTLVADYISRGTAEEAERIRRIAAAVIFVLSIGASILLWSLRDWLAVHFFADSRVSTALIFMPLALIFSCEAAVLQAYYHGRNNMKPFAVSQGVEQVVRIGLTIVLLSKFQTAPLQAAAAMAASAAAEIAGFAALVLFRRTEADAAVATSSIKTATAPLLRNMIALSLPLMFSGFVGSVLHMANVVLVPRRLFQCGYSMGQATKAMGELFGMAQPIVFFPQVLVYPAASALLPLISAAGGNPSKEADLAKKLRKAYRGAVGLGIVSLVLLYIGGPQIAQALYGTAVAGKYIKMLALALPCAFTGVISIAILNGLRKNTTVLLVTFLDAVVETGLLYALTQPRFGGLNGTVAATLAGWIFFASVAGVAAYMEYRKVFYSPARAAAALRSSHQVVAANPRP
jgi:stage V sporulation protein B